jgi:cysteine desulfurase / selenocysteine lyase
MMDYSRDFELEKGQVWLNAASEGPIPTVSANALREAITWKLSPHRLTIPMFGQVPLKLKKSIAQLISVSSDDVILGNSATYGLHLLANGLPLKSGDEILLMQNDFPTDILPWLHLTKKGVVVKQLKGVGDVLTTDEVKSHLNANVKVVCLPYIHTFSGYGLDIEAIGKLCRQKNITFIVNIAQAAGAFPLDIGRMPIDAVIGAGYKWLLGPYGTGFCWMTSKLRETLDYPQAYWISLMDEKSLASTDALSLKDDHSSRRYDVFGTANFFNYVPWTASIDYLNSIGLGNVWKHNQELVSMVLEGLTANNFKILSPTAKNQITNIVVFSHQDPSKNFKLFEALKEKGIHLAFWKNKLRIAPHIYNTRKDIEEFVWALKKL